MTDITVLQHKKEQETVVTEKHPTRAKHVRICTEGHINSWSEGEPSKRCPRMVGRKQCGAAWLDPQVARAGVRDEENPPASP